MYSSEHEFQDKPRFPGAANSYYTEKMDFVNPDDGEALPVYRVMDRNGKVFDETHDPKVQRWSFVTISFYEIVLNKLTVFLAYMCFFFCLSLFVTERSCRSELFL